MKHLFYLLIILTFFSSCKSTSGIVTSKTDVQKRDHSKISKNKKNQLAEQLINSASVNLGVSYRSGGTTKKGFDCSGLIYATFKQFDIALPRSSSEMAKVGKKINITEVQKGDLIFFKTNGQSVINHVGMVIEVLSDEIKFIHSSTSKGVVISSTKQGYYAKSFVQANRIL